MQQIVPVYQDPTVFWQHCALSYQAIGDAEDDRMTVCGLIHINSIEAMYNVTRRLARSTSRPWHTFRYATLYCSVKTLQDHLVPGTSLSRGTVRVWRISTYFCTLSQI